MNATTKSRFRQVLVWFVWLLVVLATLRSVVLTPAVAEPLAAVAACPPGHDPFPWRPRLETSDAADKLEGRPIDSPDRPQSRTPRSPTPALL